MSSRLLCIRYGIEVIMNTFKQIVREERHFCNHLFRLLCFKKEDGGKESGVGRFLALFGFPIDINVDTVKASEIYTEVAIFRDFYHSQTERQGFLIDLYERLLPILREQYGGRITNPTPIGDLLPGLQGTHPKDFSQHILDPEDDKFFYREFSALFSAKPDFLLICDKHMVWLEVKVWSSFSTKQLIRTQNIANLCSSDLFSSLFANQANRVVRLGTKRHIHAGRGDDFIDWADVAALAEKLLPDAAENYTASALKTLVAKNEAVTNPSIAKDDQ